MNLGFDGDQSRAGSALDRILSFAIPAYGLMRTAQGAFDESQRPGTIFEYGDWGMQGANKAIDTAGGWLGGLLDGAPQDGITDAGTYSYGLIDGIGYEVPGDSFDAGSYTDTGSYGYGTIDGIGVEDPDY